jgi:mRNA-degrading endonuclease toxin of MazEF toxin-antitoxin module
MKIGDIHWVELPDAGGREQSGRRPAVIMQDDSYAIALPTQSLFRRQLLFR